MWQIMGHNESVFKQSWPKYDKEKMKEDTIEIAVQINGKFRDSIFIAPNESKDSAIAIAKEKLDSKLKGLNIVKEIYVPGRIINIVAK